MKHPQYNPDLDNPPLNDADMDELDQMLLSVASEDSILDMESLDGYLTALLLAPALPDADVWIPRIWGSDDPDHSPFPSGKKTKKLVQLVLRHLASIDRQLRADPDGLEPLFGIAEQGEGDEIEEIVDAELWCIGFLHATAFDAEWWNARFDDPQLADLLTPIVLLGGDPDTLTDAQKALILTPEGRDALSRQVPEAISELARHRSAP
ncbi:MAG: hypothetical protein RL456_1068 [Pseudomonadota bacterium]